MKQLTQTQDYLLLIDEEIVCKTGELYLTSIQKRIIPKSKGVIQAGDKIIAYRRLNENAKELDLPELPPFEVDIEELACKKYDIKLGINDYDERYYNSHNVAKAEAFIEGYRAAQSKQFSLDDMLWAFRMGRKKEVIGDRILNITCETTEEEFLQNPRLSTQQLPKEFIPEYEKRPVCRSCNKQGYRHCAHPEECGGWIEMDFFKTITNSEGKQELVGVYKY